MEKNVGKLGYIDGTSGFEWDVNIYIYIIIIIIIIILYIYIYMQRRDGFLRT